MKKVSSALLPTIAIDRKASTPIHRQVYERYRAAIVEGTLRPGQRMPSTRLLATELGVSRIPILNAYAQLLAEGYFQSRVGAGTVVSLDVPDHVSLVQPRRTSQPQPGPRPVGRRPVTLPLPLGRNLPRGSGAFVVGQVASDQFPFQVWNGLVSRYCRSPRGQSLDYGDPMGSRRLREALSEYLRTARGVRCEADQIMIVSGSQQALDIASRVLLDHGSRVWMEEPGYRFARGVLRLNGCEIVPVPVDPEGLNVAAGIQRCRKARAALVTPSHQYPLGYTMSASRRLQLLDWAERTGAWIIEDDYDSEYRYENMPIGSLQGIDRNARVLYVGTFSKVLGPALRLGYLVIPNDLAGRFLEVRSSMDIGPATFFQAVLADFIREGHFSRHNRRMRMLYGERRTRLIECLREELGSAAEVLGGEAGMHLSVTLKGIRDHEVAQVAAQRKLWLSPLSASYCGKPQRQGFILGFGNVPVNEIEPAVRQLRSVLRT
ncbi:MAG TPA: PLP-dependent aminotransferase family protein [Terriglobales bacterium]|nr:PLP-dependent aminotransferase family protein [Terriglobales bacterium]